MVGSHLEVVIRRMLLRADGSGRPRLAGEALTAMRSGRGLEGAKILGDLLAGSWLAPWTSPVTRRIRDAFVLGWDVGIELLGGPWRPKRRSGVRPP